MTPSEPPLDALLDRARALREIAALLAEARARGEAAIVRVAGPPGIGKTTLLRHVAAAACGQAGRPRWASAEPGDRTRPGAVVAALLGSTRVVLPEAALRGALLDALPRDAVVCVDDVQWLDEISLRVLRGVARARRADVALLLGDRREDAPELPHHRTVRLAPLRTSAAATLIRRRYARASAEVVDEIIAAAAGLPFALELLADEAARQRARARDDTEPSVATALARRLDRCTARARDIVRACALLGGEGDLHTIARAFELPLSACSQALTELGDLVRLDGMRMTFRHQAIAEAVRATIADPVSYFTRLQRALDPGDERTEALAVRLHCAVAAGDDAAAAACALRLGRTLKAAGLLQTALEYCAIASHHAPRPLPAEYALAYAGVLQQLARDEESALFLRTELRGAIERQDADSAAALLVSYGAVALTLERFSELAALCERVATIATTQAERATIDNVRRSAAAFGGDIAAFERLAGAGDSESRDGRPAAFVAALRGDADGARAAFERYQAGLRPAHEAHRAADRALHAMLGLLSVGTSALAAVDQSWRTDGERGSYATGTAMRIFARLNDGRWLDADAIVASLPLDDDAYEEPYAVLDARLAFSAIAKRPLAAADRTLRALRSIIAAGRTRHAIAAASWFTIAIEHADAIVPADVRTFVAAQLDAVPMPYLLGGIPLYVALLAPRLGRERCEAALTTHDRFGSNWHQAHRALAGGLLAHDHERLRRARDAFDALDAPAFAMLAGMALPVPRAADAALARRLGVDGEVAPKPPLTRRERDVAELAAQGTTNHEIAIALCISERTVEVHLTNAFRKLAVRSRGELAAVVLGLRLGKP